MVQHIDTPSRGIKNNVMSIDHHSVVAELQEALARSHNRPEQSVDEIRREFNEFRESLQKTMGIVDLAVPLLREVREE